MAWLCHKYRWYYITLADPGWGREDPAEIRPRFADITNLLQFLGFFFHFLFFSISFCLLFYLLNKIYNATYITKTTFFLFFSFLFFLFFSFLFFSFFFWKIYLFLNKQCNTTYITNTNFFKMYLHKHDNFQCFFSTS